MAQVLKSDSLLAKKASRGKKIKFVSSLLASICAVLHLAGSYYLIFSVVVKYMIMIGFGSGIVLYQLGKKHYGSYIAGAEGEQKVAQFLAQKLSDDWLLLNDIEVISNNKTAQIDHILVGPYGIVLIETKNVKGRISLSDRKQYWNQDKKYNTKQIYSPTLQARGHEAAVKSVVALFHLNQFIAIRSVVLFCDGEVELELPCFVDGIPVKTMGSLTAIDFTGGKEPNLNRQEVEHIGRTLLAIHGEPVRTFEKNICPFHGGRFGI